MLSELDLPGDIRKLTDEQKKELAGEIRKRLIDVVSKRGGHLASNLGVVELTIALYSVFDPFIDKVIWDVGHQSYVHKILTKRNEAFDTLRQQGGLSGFPSISESKADCFGTGHSSTSISAALGMARARDILGQNYKVVAVIGDGALTGGMAIEALNDAGRALTNILVILNDNGMSISRNVGGMSRYLGRIRTGRSYIRIKKGVKYVLGKIPLIGKWLVRGIKRFKASIKMLLIPGELFEEMGLSYVGPIDGHNMRELNKALIKVSYMSGPVIMHVITKKGKGYKEAEDMPSKYHGLSPVGTVKNDNASFSANFGNVLANLCSSESNICAVTAAMNIGTGLEKFSRIYPDRFFDVGIAEQHAITMAAGMAAAGLRPFVAMYSTFSQRAFDQILHDCALQCLPVVICLDRAGVCGRDGKTHQGLYDMAMLRSIPDCTLCAPCCVSEQTQMLKLASVARSLFILRYPAADCFLKAEKLECMKSIEYGKGVFVCGNEKGILYDVLLVGIGIMTNICLDCADMLEKCGLKVSVFNVRFLVPFDKEAILDFLKTQNSSIIIASAEDGVIKGGLGSALDEVLAGSGLKHISFGFPTESIEHGDIFDMYRKYGMDAEGIETRILTERMSI